MPGFIRGNCGGTFHIKLEGRYFLPACFRGNLVLFFHKKLDTKNVFSVYIRGNSGGIFRINLEGRYLFYLS